MAYSKTISFSNLLLILALISLVAAPAAFAGSGGKININTATVEQLQTLPKIGPKTAEAVVEYRNTHGNFNSVEDLLNVKGIGEKKLELLRPLVTVGKHKKK